jgi:hypothetical protein
MHASENFGGVPLFISNIALTQFLPIRARLVIK